MQTQVKVNREKIKKHLKRMAINKTVLIQVFPEKGSDSKVKPDHFYREVNDALVEEIVKLNKARAVVSVLPQKSDGKVAVQKTSKRFVILSLIWIRRRHSIRSRQ